MNLEERRKKINAIAVRILPDGREVAIIQMIFNVRLVIGDPESEGYDDAYCFDSAERAMIAYAEWDGKGDPEGWIKHIGTQRFRPDGDPEKEYVQR